MLNLSNHNNIQQQFLYSDWLKTCQLMPNQWNFTSTTLNRIRFVFLPYMINHFYILTFLCFLPQYQRQRKCVFFFRARAEKGIARHIDASSLVRALVIFDWFVLSMRMQVILDSPFARPGSASIGGGKKGEFRDWTN